MAQAPSATVANPLPKGLPATAHVRGLRLLVLCELMDIQIKLVSKSSTRTTISHLL
jgi:hypothetical protein